MKTLPLILMLALAVSAQADYTQIWHCSGENDSSNFGYGVVGVGDQNDDGFDDILITNWRAGEVFLYYGGNPMDTIPDLIFAEPYYYSYGTLPQQCRDLNGDGYSDIAVSADWYGSYGRPKVYVYFGGPNIDNAADLIFTSDHLDSLGSHFGKYFTMGDFNGDGFYDLGVGADNYGFVTCGGLDGGKIFVYYGGVDMDTLEDYTITGQLYNWALTGECLSISGDVNNDGCDDMLVRTGAGSIDKTIFLGGIDPDSSADWRFVNSSVQGWSVIVPDVNQDGCDEIVFGYQPNGECCAAFFWGGDTISASIDVILSGMSSSQNGLAYAGDINADGYSDVLLGSIPHGEIYVCFLNPNMSGWYYSEYTFYHSGFGNMMGYAGDVNGDGIDDIMISSAYSPYFPFRGEVFIYSDTTLTPAVPQKPDYSLTTFRLLNNYPNPFNNRSIILFSLDRPQFIDLNVYNLLGRKVALLTSGQYDRGFHRTFWDGCDFYGNTVSSGIYLLELRGQFNRSVRKIEIIK